MRVHVLPVFGSLKLNDIDKIKIRDFRNVLYNRKYSGSMIKMPVCN
ncbi:MAG: hypothetical protein JXN64_11305 [Spirochaetes bacterium]|nr:hypothetical protein [Spirochaetota bacterium]